MVLPTLARGIFSADTYRICRSSGVHSEIIKEMFQLQIPLYYVLVGGNIIEDNKLKQGIEKRIPGKLLEFKFLLSPIRLSIIKLLTENLMMTSVQIKETLEISWNDYSTHIKALQKVGYIRTWNDLSDVGKKQIISIEPLGDTHFKDLIELLQIFIDNVLEYPYYMDTFSETESSESNLYPK